MGYFKRKLDRGRCRKIVRDLHDRALDDENWRPWEGEQWAEPSRLWYIRFSVAERHPWSGQRRGVFSAAYRLRRTGDLDAETLEQLNLTLEWFGEHLPAPDFEEDAAVFYFKSDHVECTRRIWDLVWILREHDQHVELQRVANPGRIVHEDEYQVAAVAWTGS